MFNPFRPKPQHCHNSCHRPAIKVRVLPVKLKCNTFATFMKVLGRAVQADWLLTDLNQLSYINNKPYIALSIDLTGLATTSIVKQYVDLNKGNLLAIKKLELAIKALSGSTIKLGDNYQAIENSLVDLNKDTTVTKAINLILKAISLLTIDLDGNSNIVGEVYKLNKRVDLILSLTIPTIVLGLFILELGGEIQEVLPTTLLGNKLYVISGGFSGQLPEAPEYGTTIKIVFSKGSLAMSVFTTGKDTIGYISLEYGAPVTKIYIGVTLTGALLTSTLYKLIYLKSSIPLYSGNWIVL